MKKAYLLSIALFSSTAIWAQNPPSVADQLQRRGATRDPRQVGTAGLISPARYPVRDYTKPFVLNVLNAETVTNPAFNLSSYSNNLSGDQGGTFRSFGYIPVTTTPGSTSAIPAVPSAYIPAIPLNIPSVPSLISPVLPIVTPIIAPIVTPRVPVPVPRFIPPIKIGI
jgi:hypothetical protein